VLGGLGGSGSTWGDGGAPARLEVDLTAPSEVRVRPPPRRPRHRPGARGPQPGPRPRGPRQHGRCRRPHDVRPRLSDPDEPDHPGLGPPAARRGEPRGPRPAPHPAV